VTMSWVDNRLDHPKTHFVVPRIMSLMKGAMIEDRLVRNQHTTKMQVIVIPKVVYKIQI